MELPVEPRSEIADSIVSDQAPVVFFGATLVGIGILLIGGHQYHRLILTVLVFVLIIPS